MAKFASLSAQMITASRGRNPVPIPNNDTSGLIDVSDMAQTAFSRATPSPALQQQDKLRRTYGRSGSENQIIARLQEELAAAHELNRKITTELGVTKSQLSEAVSKLGMDKLTGLKNRDGLETAFTSEESRILRAESVGSVVLMMDLNGFKQANDTYGHQAGDECLRVVARVLQESIRPTDIAARLGGDEFVVVLTNTSPVLAARHIRQIHHNLNNANAEFDGHTIPIKSSMGTSECNASRSFDEALRRADENMYRSKRALKAGRDHNPSI